MGRDALGKGEIKAENLAGRAPLDPGLAPEAAGCGGFWPGGTEARHPPHPNQNPSGVQCQHHPWEICSRSAVRGRWFPVEQRCWAKLAVCRAIGCGSGSAPRSSAVERSPTRSGIRGGLAGSNPGETGVSTGGCPKRHTPTAKIHAVRRSSPEFSPTPRPFPPLLVDRAHPWPAQLAIAQHPGLQPRGRPCPLGSQRRHTPGD